MKLILLLLLLCPVYAGAQPGLPRFENDTLYTLSGYKIFQGQTIEFGSGTERYNRFKFVSVKNGILSTSLTNNVVIIKSFKKFWISGLKNGYIVFDGYLKRNNGITEYIVLQMAFDRAIENSPVLPSEIKVPDEFRNVYPRNIEREKQFIRNMYGDNVLTKEQFIAYMRKLEKE